MSLKIALAGNPNSGKTTLFNGLTGSESVCGKLAGVRGEKRGKAERQERSHDH